MNGIDYFADTNALIYLLNGNPCMQDFLHSSLAVSVISELEILSFSDITTEEESTIRQLLADCLEVGISAEIKEIVIKLKRKYKIKLPDAIIASTAIWCDVPLITADKDFSKITELKLNLVNPIC